MKIELVKDNSALRLTAERPTDLWTLGRISALTKSEAFWQDGRVEFLEVPMKNVINALNPCSS
jgi:hypothetical protein